VKLPLLAYGILLSFITASVPLASFWIVHSGKLEESSKKVLLDFVVRGLSNVSLQYLELSGDLEAFEKLVQDSNLPYKRLCLIENGNPIKCIGEDFELHLSQSATPTITYQEKDKIHVQIPIQQLDFNRRRYLYAVVSTQLINKLLSDIKEHQAIDIFQVLLVLIPITSIAAFLTSRKVQEVSHRMAQTCSRIQSGDSSLDERDLIGISSKVLEIQQVVDSYNLLVGNLAKVSYLNQQLLSAYQMQGEHEMEQRRRMLAVIGHEMKTPLALVRGMILESLSSLEELTKDDGLPKAVFASFKDRLVSILEKTDILQAHVRGALALCRDGAIQVKPAWMNVPAWIESISELASHLVKQSRNRLEIKSHHQGIFFYTDQCHLTHAVLALLDNAVKYTKDGCITLEIKASGAWLQIGVRDTGKGIPKTVLEKIFDPFFRLSSEAPGIGIGLYIAKRNIEALGGKIEVETQENAGSQFRIVVPSARQDANQSSEAISVSLNQL
jgi:signal transduction histidine kinase